MRLRHFHSLARAGSRYRYPTSFAASSAIASRCRDGGSQLFDHAKHPTLARHMRLRNFGPGLLVAAAFIGPGTIVTASRAGASYGSALLWAVVFSAIATAVLQEMAARVGLVNPQGVERSDPRQFLGAAHSIPLSRPRRRRHHARKRRIRNGESTRRFPRSRDFERRLTQAMGCRHRRPSIRALDERQVQAHPTCPRRTGGAHELRFSGDGHPGEALCCRARARFDPIDARRLPAHDHRAHRNDGGALQPVSSCEHGAGEMACRS